MAPHRNPPLPNQQQQPKTAGANSKLDKTWGKVSRVTEFLKDRNNRHIVLDILRRAERPTTTAEIAEKFANEADLGSEATRLVSALTSRFSATLSGLVKQGLVRQAGTADGRRHLWEVSR
ncbi:hypothetical protein HFO97_07925 [Rhizobium leguminosarum]|uniref:hypothetical protein n=1 Tax=Rhizobium leguminosarum TaxID=384 RepID=UPI001C94B5BA|nr:hypothetical protein [Rhizobium leguminosarum]MBY5359897.1 hypothetical protein [Rhizobium leguminosarum]